MKYTPFEFLVGGFLGIIISFPIFFASVLIYMNVEALLTTKSEEAFIESCYSNQEGWSPIAKTMSEKRIFGEGLPIKKSWCEASIGDSVTV